MDLVSEMKVMKTIGKHKNIINLLGVCTQEGNFLLWLGLFTRTLVCIFSIPFLYISYGAGKENLFNDQESLYSVIFPYIFVTVMFDSRVVLEGEIRC